MLSSAGEVSKKKMRNIEVVLFGSEIECFVQSSGGARTGQSDIRESRRIPSDHKLDPLCRFNASAISALDQSWIENSTSRTQVASTLFSISNDITTVKPLYKPKLANT